MSHPLCLPKASMTWPSDETIDLLRKNLGDLMQKRSGASLLGKMEQSLVQCLQSLEQNEGVKEAMNAVCDCSKNIQGSQLSKQHVCQLEALWAKLEGWVPKIVAGETGDLLQTTLDVLECLVLLDPREDGRKQTIVTKMKAVVALVDSLTVMSEYEDLKVGWLDGGLKEKDLSSMIRSIKSMVELEDAWCQEQIEEKLKQARKVEELIKNHVMSTELAAVKEATTILQAYSGCGAEGRDWDATLDWGSSDWKTASEHAARTLLCFDVKSMVKLISPLEEVLE